MKTCYHCHQPLVAADAKWEVTISSRTTDGNEVFIVHEHYGCAVKADHDGTARAIAAIEQAERAGVA